jgi:hypothetical protein
MTKQSIPPHISGLFYQLLGERNTKVADFKLLTLKGCDDVTSTSKRLRETLQDISELEIQLEALVEFYPDLNENDNVGSSVVPNENPIGADSEML